jgi:hypothetical protein
LKKRIKKAGLSDSHPDIKTAMERDIEEMLPFQIRSNIGLARARIYYLERSAKRDRSFKSKAERELASTRDKQEIAELQREIADLKKQRGELPQPYWISSERSR